MVAPMSIKQFSERAGIDPRTTKRFIAAGRIPAIRLGPKIIRIPGEAAERILTQGIPDEAPVR
jgi:excisionase family DNA binding protein